MNGTWKENVSGWDRKGNKRKKQSRKHTLKDKVKPLIRKFHYNEEYNDTIWIEGDANYIKPEKYIYKKSGFIETWSIEVSRYIGQKVCEDYLLSEYSYNNRVAYQTIDDKWYDEYTNEPIDGIVKKLHFKYKEEVTFDEPVKIYVGTWSRKPSTDETIFIYGKPITDNYTNQYGFWSARRRKWIQTSAHRKDRALLRQYISNSDWNKDVKTHPLSKSISWEVW